MGSPSSMSPLPPPKPHNPPQPLMPLWKKRKALLKELSLNEIPRNAAWERRRCLKLMREKKNEVVATVELSEDLNELKGCIELGFGFNENKGGQSLTNTLPALDIYFAVNRLGTPMVSPNGNTSPLPLPKLKGIGSVSSNSRSDNNEETWKICNPGEHPQQVKARLRHWAQAVACSVIQGESK